MRSVIRGKIWEGRCVFGTEEQRTSGKKEYVVDSQLRAFSTQLFDEGKYRNYFFHTCELFIFRYKSWFRHGLKKRILALQATILRDFARRVDKPQLTRWEELREGLHAALKRFHENIDSVVITPAKCSLNYLPFSNQTKKTDWFNFSLSCLTAWYS